MDVFLVSLLEALDGGDCLGIIPVNIRTLNDSDILAGTDIMHTVCCHSDHVGQLCGRLRYNCGIMGR